MKLVATVSNNEEIKLAEKADIIEIRLDLFNTYEIKVRKDLIATFRRERDGGKFKGNEEERIGKLKWFVEEYKAKYVDVEFDVPDKLFDFNCKIIESYHNFHKTPEYSELRKIVENRRGDIVKIATMGRSKKDVEKIVKLLAEYENVVAFLMGDRFSYTRIIAVFLGSPFVYCYVGESKAPGQLHLEDAYRILRILSEV